MKFKRYLIPKGQDLVEYALLLPFMLIMIMVIFDLGRITFLYSTLTNISREGARYGVVHQCDTLGVIAAAKDKAIGINPDDLNFNIPPALPLMWSPLDCSYPDPPGSGTVIVSISFNFIPMTPFVVDILAASDICTLPDGTEVKCFPTNSTTTMYLEL